MNSRDFAASLVISSVNGPAYPAPSRSRAYTSDQALQLAPISTLPDVNATVLPSITGDHHPQSPLSGSQTPAKSSTGLVQESNVSTTPSELEASTPPDARTVTDIVPSFYFPSKNKWRVLCACLTYFGNGMMDAAPGALIPYMERHYNIGYAVVSLIFITNAVGFIVTAFGSDAVYARLGRARTLALGELIMIAGFVVIVSTPPYPAVVVAYLFLGLGYAFNLALNNVFVSNLADSTIILGAAHGSYGVGGLVAPIIATVMASRGILWSRFFIIILGLRLFILFFTTWANKGYEQEPTSRFTASLDRIASQQAATEPEPNKLQLLKQVLKNRVTLLGALFIFAYQGAEVSISGWVISYLIQARDGDPAEVGYVTSGFWGGITLGRFVLVFICGRIGERLSVYVLIAGSVALQLVVWLVPNIVGDAVAVSLLGLLLGPVYPCAATIFARLLPMKIQVSSISFIAGAGSSGGALAPFMTGLLAQAAGTFVLHPICIGLFLCMMLCWRLIPVANKKTE